MGQRLNAALVGVGLTASAIYAFHPDGLALAGKPHEVLSDSEVDRLADQKRYERYKATDDLGRFTLQFLQDARLGETVVVGDMQGGKGLVGNVQGMWGQETSYPLGRSCLEASVYHVGAEPGEITEPIDRAPTLGTIDGTVVVSPGASTEPTLRFRTDINGELQPEDATTEGVLEDRGCEPWYQIPPVVQGEGDIHL